MEGIFYLKKTNLSAPLDIKFEGVDLNEYNAKQILDYFESISNNENIEIENNLIKIDQEFSIAISDYINSEIHLIRDIFGIIPLYYTIQDNLVAYSTNINYLLKLDNFEIKPNLNKIHDFLLGIPAYASYTEETYFENIFSVIPGQILTLSKEAKSYKNFFNLSSNNFSYSDEKIIKRDFLNLFKTAVSKKINSSKNVTSMLSGGIDSSSITCIASILSERPINTIEVRTNFEIIDERNFAQEVVEKYNLNHTIIREFDNLIETEIDFAKHICSPGHFGLSPSRHYEISKLIQQSGSNVLLEGFGGDEILGMDSLYFNELFSQKKWKKLNISLKQRSKEHHYNFWTAIIKSTFKQKKYFEGCSQIKKSGLFFDLLMVFITKYSKLNKPYIVNESLILFIKDENKPLKFNHLDLINNNNNRPHIDYIKTFLNKTVFNFNENAYQVGKKFNYNYRFPFFDLNLASFIADCPKEYNFGNGIARYVIRESLNGILPDKIRLRKTKTSYNPLVLEIFKKKYPEFIEKFSMNHIIWEYIDRLMFMDLSKKIIEEKPIITNGNIIFCNKIISLGIWLDIFFEKK